MCLSLRPAHDPRDVTQLPGHDFTHFALRRSRPASVVPGPRVPQVAARVPGLLAVG